MTHDEAHPRNTCELEIDLFCQGMRIESGDGLDGRVGRTRRTRAGLGSGVELVLRGESKDIWVNVPVHESFAQRSPYVLRSVGDGGVLVDERNGLEWPVGLPQEPQWYTANTRSGVPMQEVGVLQGTSLGIYISEVCGFWRHRPEEACKFCTTGLNVGANERTEKTVEDVVDVARAAKRESGVTFVHLNSGYHGDDGLRRAAPFVRALKQEVGVLVGVQLIPEAETWKYDRLIDLGADHFSFCFEFHDPHTFTEILPGKSRHVGQQAFYDALAHCSRRLGPGTCSGEIIAGVEPVQHTLEAIDHITALGAFPTVCIFRPTIGSQMESHAPPEYRDMRRVMHHMARACRRHRIPIGMQPNLEVSLVVLPAEALSLEEPSPDLTRYRARLAFQRKLAVPVIAWRMRRRRARVQWSD